ncbi:TatD family hydrolase [Pseudorhodoferax sp.]|jgi:TatD DNase family protein|uniref:TatD family hydrolase n=1 Tax=Pseudorhodoferax sp. TaxID=1993553 RepID=UPI002DD67D18|nr:TatD family hydrolase [Pseudorhodoferax sp.]
MSAERLTWIDTHCHLDAPEFDPDRREVRARARDAGVGLLVLPAVHSPSLAVVQALARQEGDAYALGFHPLYVEQQLPGALQRLADALGAARDDPHLVAVGEIGLDGFVAGLDPHEQARWCAAQLALARDAGLPVILHVRRAVDPLLALLRRTRVSGGIAHAFNGSEQQARAFLDLGFKLGFGGAMTQARALQIRRLAADLPADAWVLETDAPDIPPAWLYRSAQQRQDGLGHGRNEPAELPRIARTLAELRGLNLSEVARQSTANAVAALPRLLGLLPREAT